MSILLVGAEGDVAPALVARLVAQGDEVRVIEPGPEDAADWKGIGAYVARGDPSDEDLVERAAQNVRTIVVLDERADLEPVVEGAVRAKVGRIVWLARTGRPEVARLRAAGLDYVVIEVPRGGFRRRMTVSPAELAEAIDAADDLAGNPRLEIDLGEPDGWERLGL